MRGDLHSVVVQSGRVVEAEEHDDGHQRVPKYLDCKDEQSIRHRTEIGSRDEELRLRYTPTMLLYRN